MTSGIGNPSPASQYGDWLVAPHCMQCTYANGSDNPYWWCIPAKHTPLLRKTGVFVAPSWQSGRYDVVFSQWDELPARGSGTRWIGFLPLVQLENLPEESEGTFQVRLEKTARQELEKRCGPIINGTVAKNPMEDPAFHRFETE